MSPWLVRRRFFDRALALALLIVCAPALAVLVFMTVFADSGPGLVRLERVGVAGRRFLMVKVRSMHHRGRNAAANGPLVAGGRDRRVTPLGRVLRRSRLDELPNLWNVFRGEMSLIGPRPETPPYVDTTDERWQDVLRARPGIAGPTQAIAAAWEATHLGEDSSDLYVSTALPVKLDIDAWYVANASPSLDVLVLWSLLCGLVGLEPKRLQRRILGSVESATLFVPDAVAAA